MNASQSKDSGQLMEVLLDLEKSSLSEKRAHEELTMLCRGLKILTDFDNKETLFTRLLNILKEVLKFENAIILTSTVEDGDRMHVVFSTAPQHEKGTFHSRSLFNRVIAGSSVACFNIDGIEEWDAQSARFKNGVKSALHLRLKNENRSAILICTHTERGFFNARDVSISEKFALLVSQALSHLDFTNALKKINQSLELEIQERIKTEKLLETQQAKILHTSKMVALGEMAGGVAHEINNPLATIQLSAEQLQELVDEGVFDPKNISKLTAQISATVFRIAKIVSGLRLFSRDVSRDLLESFSLRKIIENVFFLCTEKLKNSGAKIEIQLPDESLLIYCRPVQIEQVLLNLINNSIDAITHLPEKWIKLSVRSSAIGVEIFMMDSGPRISSQVREKLFQPFFTTKEVGKGTGLGLSVSRGLIEQVGGTLSLDESYSNTCFKIFLPVKPT
jgi:phosphoglycerate-specific signal transduction histidine kinase